jgi:hypothetical protein
MLQKVESVQRHCGGQQQGVMAINLAQFEALLGDLLCDSDLFQAQRLEGRWVWARKKPRKREPRHVASQIKMLPPIAGKGKEVAAKPAAKLSAREKRAC